MTHQHTVDRADVPYDLQAEGNHVPSIKYVLLYIKTMLPVL